MRRSIVACAAFVVASLPAAALAHAGLNESSPAKGSSVGKVPDDVVLSMSETPVEAATDVVVIDGCGNPVVESISTHDKEIHAEIVAEAHPGRWKVQYQTLSAEDGHESSGRFAFKVKGARDCTVVEEDDEPDEAGSDSDQGPQATDDSGDDDDSGLPVVPIVVGAGALIGVAALARGASGKS